jgi:hypothetical protein
MNWIGHYEFGLNQKPFELNSKEKNTYSNLDINYWLNTWLNYYSYVLNHNLREEFILINYEDLCINPSKTLNQISIKTNLKHEFSINKKFIKRNKSGINLDSDGEIMLNKCMKVFHELVSFTVS